MGLWVWGVLIISHEYFTATMDIFYVSVMKFLHLSQSPIGIKSISILWPQHHFISWGPCYEAGTLVESVWERGPVVASSSRYPRVRGSIPPLGTLGNVSENQFLGSTQAMWGNMGRWHDHRKVPPQWEVALSLACVGCTSCWVEQIVV